MTGLANSGLTRRGSRRWHCGPPRDETYVGLGLLLGLASARSIGGPRGVSVAASQGPPASRREIGSPGVGLPRRCRWHCTALRVVAGATTCTAQAYHPSSW